MTIQQLQAEFDRQPVEVQNEIMHAYIEYVTEYPDDHEEGDYPASFLEWWTNDYQEMLDEMKGKI